MNGVTVTQASDLNNYRPFFEGIFPYGSDAAASHLKNAFWNLDNGDLFLCKPNAADTNNKDIINRCDRIKQSKEFELYGQIHSEICNIGQHLLPVLQMPIKLTKAWSRFHLLKKDAESKMVYKFLDAQIKVNRVRATSSTLYAHNETLAKGNLTRYNLTRVELNYFTLPIGSQFQSIETQCWDPCPCAFYSPR